MKSYRAFATGFRRIGTFAAPLGARKAAITVAFINMGRVCADTRGSFQQQAPPSAALSFAPKGICVPQPSNMP